MAFACKSIFYGIERNIDPQYDEIFNEFFHQAHCNKQIPENEANVILLFAKYFQLLYFQDRAIKIAEDLKKLCEILIGRKQGPYFDLIEGQEWNEIDLMNKINDASFFYVQNEGDPSLDEFKSVCASLTEHYYQTGEIVDRHLGLRISEETWFLARYFSSENFKCDCVETREYECLRMLETKFNDHFMIKCKKPPASLSFLSYFANKF